MLNWWRSPRLGTCSGAELRDVLEEQRGIIVFRQPCREGDPQLFEGPQSAGPAVGLTLVQEAREQVAPVPGDLGQKPCLAAPVANHPAIVTQSYSRMGE
jgi:hypothetical protein